MVSVIDDGQPAAVVSFLAVIRGLLDEMTAGQGRPDAESLAKRPCFANLEETGMAPIAADYGAVPASGGRSAFLLAADFAS